VYLLGASLIQVPIEDVMLGAFMLGLYLLPLIWYKIQMKIHESVWEGGAYVKLLEEEKEYACGKFKS